ncbi:NAD(P)-dependent oxidoreductase [Tropicimonas sp. IMCC34043]|uniref:NAD(P)-dependent oxidoreductase n=1 Tax=Tropicimonas sp. IMCC34043 TaxID=2248760 RepID=UPI001300A78F|nr:NAD(P)-dependent oxidoreductase [Tropicimonas sp. IMCC34043]
MKTFPMFLKMTGRHVVVVGGAEQAAQKARLIARTEARLLILAPRLEPELAGVVAAGRADHDAGRVGPETFEGAVLVFIATGCPGADAAMQALAVEARALVNVVDQPALCDAFTPSIVDRDPLVVAIGTEGNAPVLGRMVRARIETLLEPSLGAFAALAGRLRPEVAQHVPEAARRPFWRWVFGDAPRRLQAAGDLAAARARIDAAIAAGGAPGQSRSGSITVIGTGTGAADLLSLRAMRHLQEADILLVTDGTGPEILELARRDAERVSLAPGTDGSVRLLDEAAAGRVTVWLVPGSADLPSGGWPASARALGIVVNAVSAAVDPTPVG